MPQFWPIIAIKTTIDDLKNRDRSLNQSDRRERGFNNNNNNNYLIIIEINKYSENGL
jgi:hypothetical protein